MIYLYESTETDFTHRGLGSLTDTYSCVVTEHLNGLYDLIMEYPLNGKLYEEIKPSRLLKVKNVNGYQLFRIQKITKDLDSAMIEATHVFYDLLGNYVVGCEIENQNGTNALIQLFRATKEQTNFQVSSTIETKNSVRFIRRGLLECFFDGEVSLLHRWGGELERDNFSIQWKPRIGEDRGVSIRYAKNLLGLEFTVDYANIITTVVPHGYDGLTLPEKYVDSPIKNEFINLPRIKEIQYPEIKSKKLTPEDQFAMDHEKALEKLREFAAKEFSQNNKDKPIINCTVNFIELSATEEYKDYAVLERVYLGDTVHIQYLQQDINFVARVCSYKWDVLNQRYTFIEVGQLSKNALTSIASLENKVQHAVESTSELYSKMENVEANTTITARKAVTQLISSGFGGHVRISSDEIKIMDTDDELTAKRVWRWNLGGLAVSNSGVNGPWRSGMAEDGGFLADFISGLVIRGNMIEANSIRMEHLTLETKQEIINQVTDSSIIKEIKQQSSPEKIETIITEKTNTKINELLEQKIQELSQEVDNKLALKQEAVLIQLEEPEDKTKGWLNPITGELKLYVRDSWQLVNDHSEVSRLLKEQFTILEGKVSSKEDLALLVSDFLKLGNDWETYKRILNGDYDRFKESQNQFRSDLETLKTTITQDAQGLLIKNNQGNLSVRLGNSRLSFLDNGVEVAYVSNQRLFINSGVFLSSLTIGNYRISKSENGKMLFFDYIGGDY